MSERDLERECIAFCTYLTGERPTRYLLKKYHEAASIDAQLDRVGCDAFDAYLLALSLLHPIVLKVVDTYTRLFQTGSIVRRKLVLTLALLECAAPTYLYLERPATERRLWMLAHLLWFGLSFGIALTLAVLLLMPMRGLVWCKQTIVARRHSAGRRAATPSAGPGATRTPAAIDS
jgi:hypothetical protein